MYGFKSNVHNNGINIKCKYMSMALIAYVRIGLREHKNFHILSYYKVNCFLQMNSTSFARKLTSMSRLEKVTSYLVSLVSPG